MAEKEIFYPGNLITLLTYVMDSPSACLLLSGKEAMLAEQMLGFFCLFLHTLLALLSNVNRLQEEKKKESTALKFSASDHELSPTLTAQHLYLASAVERTLAKRASRNHPLYPETPRQSSSSATFLSVELKTFLPGWLEQLRNIAWESEVNLELYKQCKLRKRKS